jgi:hypothetical protein
VLDSEHENQGPSSQTCSSPNAFAGGYMDSLSVFENDETCYAERAGVSEHEMSSYSADTNFAEANSNSNTATVCRDNLNLSLWEGYNNSQIKHVGDDIESERMQHHYISILAFPSFFQNFTSYLCHIRSLGTSLITFSACRCFTQLYHREC